MADRLTKITTRGGDKGQTSLGDGSRVAKTDLRVAALGEIDELNSWIGVILSHEPGEPLRLLLEGVQHDLFDLGGNLCFPEMPLLTPAHLLRLDKAVDEMNKDLAPLKEFILPGGAPLLSWLHLARTVARRAERNLTLLCEQDGVSGHGLAYLNRLSDVLFIAARVEALRLGKPEVYWEKSKSVSA